MSKLFVHFFARKVLDCCEKSHPDSRCSKAIIYKAKFYNFLTKSFLQCLHPAVTEGVSMAE